MQYSNRINFVDDAETIQLYGFGISQDMTGFDPISGYGKNEQFDMSLLNMNYPPQNGMTTQYAPPSFEPPVTTSQDDLTALPGNYTLNFDDGNNYTNPAMYNFHAHQSSVPAQMVCPSNMPTASSEQQQQQPQVLRPVVNGSQISKKRRASDDSFEVVAPVSKKIALSLKDTNGDFHNLKDEAWPYSTAPTPTTIPGFHGYHHGASPHNGGHQHTGSNVSQVSVPGATPYTPTVSPAFTNANTEHSPHAPSTPLPRPSSTASNPRLVRTSTIPAHSSPAVVNNSNFVGHITTFNPYTMFSPDSKARLHLEGDLDAVANEWSEEELDMQRKIVVFDREQKGNDIYATFKVVSQSEWKNQPRTVNCIWWKEKKEAYVTSVDTILLLESLVAGRFTVEEKNRIRRNLEGFKPMTVSKAKSDSEEFFKVIMGFPNPKPRNIEKDVKVFPWKVLSVALQKIISKYSASYATTAGTMSGPPTKIYRPLEYHIPEQHYVASPGREYCTMMPHMGNYAPYIQGRSSTPVTPNPGVHYAPAMTQGMEVHHGYTYAPTPLSASYQVQSYGPPVPQQPPQWEYPPYSHSGHLPAGSASAPATAYPRDMIETASFRHPMNGNFAYQ